LIIVVNAYCIFIEDCRSNSLPVDDVRVQLLTNSVSLMPFSHDLIRKNLSIVGLILPLNVFFQLQYIPDH